MVLVSWAPRISVSSFVLKLTSLSWMAPWTSTSPSPSRHTGGTLVHREDACSGHQLESGRPWVPDLWTLPRRALPQSLLLPLAGWSWQGDPVHLAGGALDVQGALGAAGAEHGLVHLHGWAVRREDSAEQGLHAAARLGLLLLPRLHHDPHERGGRTSVPGVLLLQEQLQPRQLREERSRAAQHQEQLRARLRRVLRRPACRRCVLCCGGGGPRRSPRRLARVLGLGLGAPRLLGEALGLRGRAVVAVHGAVARALGPPCGAVAGAGVAAHGSGGRGPGELISCGVSWKALQAQAVLILLPELADQQHLAVALDRLGRGLWLRLRLPLLGCPAGLGPRPLLHVRPDTLAPLGSGFRWEGKAALLRSMSQYP
nr:uncharacterized protein LOC100984244 isoform X1 [Pan paniscus]XP_057157517.1 uncharacterized protein LOC100984244 isoform X1 [Pan paniscus]